MLQAPQADKIPGTLVPKAASGHFDELRGAGATDGLSAHWSAFFGHPGAAEPQELNLRSASLERQVRDNGVTYNVYADAGGPQRPWSLDLFPLILTPEAWKGIEAGVLQRVRLLDRVMDDVYGPQQLLARGLLPPALVHLGSLEFSKQLLTHAGVAVAPGVGYGEDGEGFVRIAMVENEHRIRQAARNVKKFLQSKGVNTMGKAGS